MKPRILVDCHKFDEHFEGSRTFIKGVYLEFAKINQDFEIFLVANDIDNLRKEFINLDGIRFIKLNYKSSVIRLLFELPFIIYRNKISFAHFQYIVPPIKLCKYIVTCHDMLFYDYPQYFSSYYRYIKIIMFKYSIKRSEIVTTVSNYSKERIMHICQINEEKIIITPNAVGKEFLQKINKEESREYIKRKYGIERYLIFVSRIEPRKNHVSLLKAFLELGLTNRGYQLVFIGENRQKCIELELMLNSLDPNTLGHIFFFENIKQSDLIHFYNAADLSVFPSVAEGFGIPPLESIALTTNTLCSNQTAMKDFDFFGDRLFNPFDIEELKEKIQLYLNSEKRDDIIAISEQAQIRFSWLESARNIYKMLV